MDFIPCGRVPSIPYLHHLKKLLTLSQTNTPYTHSLAYNLEESLNILQGFQARSPCSALKVREILVWFCPNWLNLGPAPGHLDLHCPLEPSRALREPQGVHLPCHLLGATSNHLIGDSIKERVASDPAEKLDLHSPGLGCSTHTPAVSSAPLPSAHPDGSGCQLADLWELLNFRALIHKHTHQYKGVCFVFVLFFSFINSISHSPHLLSTYYIPGLELSKHSSSPNHAHTSGSCLNLMPSQPSLPTQHSPPNWFTLKLNPSSTHLGLLVSCLVWSSLGRAWTC